MIKLADDLISWGDSPTVMAARVPDDATLATWSTERVATVLSSLVSAISEDGYCAGWMQGVELEMWECADSPRWRYGVAWVDDECRAALARCKRRLGGGWVKWVVHNPVLGPEHDAGVVFLDAAEWAAELSKYEAAGVP